MQNLGPAPAKLAARSSLPRSSTPSHFEVVKTLSNSAQEDPKPMY